MKQLLGSVEAKVLDEATLRLFSLESPILVEKASLRLWDALKAEASLARGRSTRIVALCGKGGNGDDALAMLRHAFSAGYGNLAAIIASGRTLSGRPDRSGSQEASLESAGVEILDWAKLGAEAAASILGGADLVLDGVLGTGTSGAARGEAAEMIEVLSLISKRTPRPTIIAIDLPSGAREAQAEGDACVKADLCLALEPLKKAHFIPAARSRCGRIFPVSDVFPQSLLEGEGKAFLLEASDLGALQPPLDPTAYKTKRGRLAIFAGARGTAGAARLCAKAAAASGAGYLTLYVDEDILPVMAGELESCIVKPLEAWRGDASPFDAILAGPGWGRGDGRKQLLESLAGAGLPLVLDADALRLVAEEPGILRNASGRIVLTPHPGEFGALAAALGLTNHDFSLEQLEELGRDYGGIVIYKSYVTWIRGGGGRLAVWDGMEPGLGTAGSGDVLAGLLAGLLASFAASRAASTADPDEKGEHTALESLLRSAAEAAVIAHGLAGRALSREKGWFEASDIPPACARILRESRAGSQDEA
jgi:NAD(P)H-hydrate epimerase